MINCSPPPPSTWVEGLLPHTLSSLRPGSWVVLEGALSPAQLDSLLACDGDGPLHLSNGQCLTVDPSIRFIMEVSELLYVLLVIRLYIVRVYS